MDAILAKLISPEQRDAVMAPISQALTLPAAAYVSERWFTLEVERIFKRHWMPVMFECELPDAGDAQPFELFDIPLLAVRGDDAKLRVFHNICPYDGCLVQRHPQSGLSELEVYYHGWRYDLRGNLMAAPYWNGAPACGPADLGGRTGDLTPVRCEVRLGALMINLDGEAADIDEWFAPWRAVVGDYYAVDKLVPTRDAAGNVLIEKRTVAANWKTYQENASINLLHESFTHELYRKSPEVPRVDAEGNARFKLWMDGALVAFGHSRGDSGETYDPIRLPSAGHDPGEDPEYGFFTTVYPALNVPLLDSMIKVNLILPTSAGKTELKHLRFYRPEALDCPQFEQEEQAVQTLFDTVHYEDQLAIEAVQRARRSPVWQQHYYAPFWDELHHRFNQLVMLDMQVPKPRSQS
jgi:nitrite reductase/ring-hydroxylating ferredoxin subunit